MLRVLGYVDRRHRTLTGLALVFIVAQVWLDLKLPDYMSAITVLTETPGTQMSQILIEGGFMLACALGSMVMSVAVGYIAAVVAAGLAKTLRGHVYDKTLSFSLEEMGRFSAASLINRTTNDITQIQTLVAMGLQAIVKAPILAVWAVVKISGKSWQWTSATAVAVFVLFIMLAAILIFAVPRFRQIQGLTDTINRMTREQLSGIRVVRAYNAERYHEEKFRVANDEITDVNLVANRVMALMSPVMTLIYSGLTLAVYWVGAHMIEATGHEERLAVFSDMVVFSNYAMQIIMAFMLLNMIFILLPRAQVSARRIMEVLDSETRVTDGPGVDAAPQRGTVEFRQVSFRYPGANDDTLHNISFTVQQGETVAFIGATGSGKTTLVNLIPRFYDATAGAVLVDGVDVRQYRQAELRNRIGYVSQRPVIFSGTVASNVSYGEGNRQTADAADLQQALDISQSSEFVAKMPLGLDATISQDGENLSGGQRQRLSIARAIARDPEILIFDDSFSALDYTTDATLRAALREHTTAVTKLVVAQRIGTIRHADRIHVLDHGRIVGSGTHEELMTRCPTYREIARSQLTDEELSNA